MRRMKGLALPLCAFAGFLLTLVPAAVPQNIQSVAATAARSVCIVLAERGNGTASGTGFMVADGYALTAYHVVQDADHLRVLCPDHPSIDVRLVNEDRHNDLALLHNTLLSIRPLPLGDSGKVQVGQEIVVIGFPRADLLGVETATVTQGNVGAVRAGALQIQAPVGPGNSGSPVLTLQGQVVGIVQEVLGSQVGTNFATSLATGINAAKPFLTLALGGLYGGVSVGNAPAAPNVPKPTPSSGKFVITPGQGIGDLKLGMSRDQIVTLEGGARNVSQRQDGGISINWYEVIASGWLRGLWATVSRAGDVISIGALNDVRYVIRGIHYGSTESEVRAAFGEPSRVVADKVNRLLYYDSLGLRFTIASNSGSLIYGLVHEITIYKSK